MAKPELKSLLVMSSIVGLIGGLIGCITTDGNLTSISNGLVGGFVASIVFGFLIRTKVRISSIVLGSVLGSISVLVLLANFATPFAVISFLGPISVFGLGLGSLDLVALSRMRVLTRRDYPNVQEKSFESVSVPPEQAKPPLLAQSLLEFVASPDCRDAVVGDLFEKFDRNARQGKAKDGLREARAEFWSQVLRSVPGLLTIRVRDLTARFSLKQLMR